MPGAVLVTGGLSSLVYAITQAGQEGWLAGATLGVLRRSFAMLVGFVAWELRHPEPLMRIGILQTRTVSGANVAGFILGTAMFSMFLMLTLYMQQVLGYSAMKTGVAYLAVAGTAILWSAVAAQLVTRVGVKPVLVVGDDDADRRARLLHAGVGRRLVPRRPAARASSWSVSASASRSCRSRSRRSPASRPPEAGLASGLINTSQQIGGALGIAALSTIATSRTGDAVAGGSALPSALVDGFHGRLRRRRDHRRGRESSRR